MTDDDVVLPEPPFIDSDYSPAQAEDYARAAVLADRERRQEPVAYIQRDHLQKARQAPFLCRVEPTQRRPDFDPIYAAPTTAGERQTTHSEECWQWHHECAKAEIERLRAAPPPQAEAQPSIPRGWSFRVSTSDGRSWLEITTPGGARAVLSVQSESEGGGPTIAAQVLDHLKDALAAVQPAREQPTAEMPPLPPLAANRDYRDYAVSYARMYAAKLEAQNRELRDLLAEAIEDIDSWASYASDYFQQKHDLAGTLAKYRAALQEKP